MTLTVSIDIVTKREAFEPVLLFISNRESVSRAFILVMELPFPAIKALDIVSGGTRYWVAPPIRIVVGIITI